MINAEKLAACEGDDQRFLLGLATLKDELDKHAAFEPGKWKVVSGDSTFQPIPPPREVRRSWLCAYCDVHVLVGQERTRCTNCGAPESKSRAIVQRGTNSTGPR